MQVLAGLCFLVLNEALIDFVVGRAEVAVSESDEEALIFRAQVSSRMRMLRKAMDVTQDQAAEMCAVSPRSYKDYELGRRSIPVEVLVRFCKSFKSSVEEVLFGKCSGSGHAPGADIVDELAVGLLGVFGREVEPDKIEKQAKIARYAWESARAKGRAFDEELREVSALSL